MQRVVVLKTWTMTNNAMKTRKRRKNPKKKRTKTLTKPLQESLSSPKSPWTSRAVSSRWRKGVSSRKVIGLKVGPKKKMSLMISATIISKKKSKKRRQRSHHSNLSRKTI